MPEICRFLGVIVSMYYEDHLPPHFHVKYGECEARISISDLRIVSGTLPRRVLSLVIEWAFEHRDELETNWKRCEKHAPLFSIEPLE